jgi:tRNA pseudouridine55 synthase
MESSLNGFINLNKPPNFTSHDCVAKLRRILNTKKIGHGGTLDPAATGVLPMAIGKATRLLSFLPREKIYQAKIRLGITTTTDDLEGEIIEEKSANDVTIEQIKPLLTNFIGKIEQIPPAYSAIKQDGQKLYHLARKGKIIDIPKREVEILAIELNSWQTNPEPELELTIFCQAGTYIRAIARDLGQKLGCGATLASLNRTLSCGMEIKSSLTFEQIVEQVEKDNLRLIALDSPLQKVPKINLDSDNAQRWCQGQKIKVNQQYRCPFYRTYNHQEQFLGISELRENQGEKLIKPKLVLI